MDAIRSAGVARAAVAEATRRLGFDEVIAAALPAPLAPLAPAAPLVAAAEPGDGAPAGLGDVAAAAGAIAARDRTRVEVALQGGGAVELVAAARGVALAVEAPRSSPLRAPEALPELVAAVRAAGVEVVRAATRDPVRAGARTAAARRQGGRAGAR
jgi:hypothetical protein